MAKRVPKSDICVECKEFKRISAKGLCSACYSAARRKKAGYKRVLKIAVCVGCGKSKPIKGKGRCGACYYEERLQSGYKRPKPVFEIDVCVGCGESKEIRGKKKCGACYYLDRRKAGYKHVPKIDVCVGCGETKQIESKKKCGICYAEERRQAGYKYVPRIAVCVDCGKSKPIKGRGLCGACHHSQMRKAGYKRVLKIAVCVGCEESKPIFAKKKCRPCYHQGRRQAGYVRPKPVFKTDVCAGCGELKEIRVKGKCGACYYLDRRKAGYEPQKKVFPISECIECGEYGQIFSTEKCRGCYNDSLLIPGECLGCKQDKMIHPRNILCPTCARRGSKYKMSIECLNRFYEIKHCEICSRESELDVDHCHPTGIIRGALCNRCNSGLGQLGKDTVEGLLPVLAYLERSVQRVFDTGTLLEGIMGECCITCGPAESKQWFRKLGIQCGPCYQRCNTHSIAPEVLIAMSKECEACGGTENLHIDHDHPTGIVRGILCVRCNGGLGKLGDCIEGIRSALTYLERGTVAEWADPPCAGPKRGSVNDLPDWDEDL